jgi:hypothetical protein
VTISTRVAASDLWFVPAFIPLLLICRFNCWIIGELSTLRKRLF